MKLRVVTVTALLVAMCVAPALLGQSRTQPEPTFRVRVEAVEIDASVSDAAGNPVTDLKADDFAVFEDKKAQSITSFTVVNIPVDRELRPTFAGRPIEPDVQSNDQGEGRLYVFALGEVSPEQALRTRRFIRRFMDRYFGANDLAAVTFLGRARAANAQALTNNPRLILESVDSFSGGFPNGPSVAVPDVARSGQPPAPAVDLEATKAGRDAMGALRRITESMAAIHGRRKVLLLFSEGLVIDLYRVVDYRGGVLTLAEDDAHQAITAATRSNVTIYPIDPRGLTPDGGLGEDESAPVIDSVARMNTTQSLRALAEVTGGFALVNSNSFDATFSRIVRENSTYYVIGYSSTNDKRDGRYRRLEVRVKRPGLQVRARAGYLGPMGREPVAPAPKRTTPLDAAVTTAIGSPVATTGLPLHVFAAPYKSGQGEASVAMAFEVDGRALTLTEQNGSMVGGIEVSYLAVDAQNKIVPGEYQIGNLSLKPDGYDRLRTGGLRVLSEMHLPRGRFQIRVAVGDRAGKSGSVVYDLEVPDFTRGPLTMSGVALTSKALSSMTTMRPKEPLKDALPGPITASREFARGDTVTLFVEVYDNASKAAHNVDLSAELRSEDGRAFGRVNDQRASSELSGKSGGYRFTAALPLTVEPGRYMIHVEARSTAGERPVVSRDVPVRVR